MQKPYFYRITVFEEKHEVNKMAEWNSGQYLKFKNQRTQPAVDLAKRISGISPHKVLDIGCGPGNSTAVLKSVFPSAHIVGIDNSENMIAKARSADPDLRFELMSVDDICNSNTKYDVIFSNACLQWVPDHKKVLPMLFDRLNENGVMAIQMPINTEEPLFRIITEIVNEEKWNFPSSLHEQNRTLSGSEYFDIISSLTDTFDIWETTYYHDMPSVNAMIEWVKGTRLLPYIQSLNETKAAQLIDEIKQKAVRVYKTQENGNIIFRFRRLFITAVRKENK